MRKPLTTWSASILALTCGTACLCGPTYAQGAGGDTEETIVVTAERRTQSLQSTAISAVVLNAEALENKGVTGLTALQYAAPGVQIADYASANTFNIRGVGQARVDVDLPSGVVIYRDGVPTLTGYFQNAPYYDMASIEVLRGPQGTFVGKSASAGAVFIRTRDPDLDAFGGLVQFGGGNKDFAELTLVMNQPLGDHFALRISAHKEVRSSLFDSITSNPLPGGQNAAGPFTGDDDRSLDSLRVGLLWQPTERFKVLFKTDLDHLEFGGHITTGLDPLTGALEDVRNPIVNGPHEYVDRGVRSSLNLSYEFAGGVTFNALTGFSTVNTTANWDINGSDPRPFGFRSHGNFTNWSQEFNLLSPEDQRVRWVAGLFWQDYLNSLPDYTKFGIGFDLDSGDRPDYTTPWRKIETSYAAFGQLEFDLTDRLELQVGARWNHYEFDQFTNFAIDFVSLITWSDPAGTGIGVETDLIFFEGGGLGHWQSFEEDSTDWKVNLNYQVTDEHFIYGVISRGHTPGSINLIDPDFFATPDHDPYREMSVINYELGWKGEFAQRHVRTQLNVYYQVFKDYQADFALLAGPNVPPAATLFQFQNALTDSIIYGAEFGAQADFGAWAWDLGLAYTKSELGSFGMVANPFAAVFGGAAQVDLEGARTPFSPEFTGNVGVEYTFDLGGEGEGLTMTPRLDVAYRGEAYARLFQNPATFLDAVTLLNAQLRFESGPWSFNVWGTNLTDEEYASAKQNIDGEAATATRPFPHISGIVYAGPPRLFGVRVGRTF